MRFFCILCTPIETYRSVNVTVDGEIAKELLNFVPFINVYDSFSRTANIALQFNSLSTFTIRDTTVFLDCVYVHRERCFETTVFDKPMRYEMLPFR